MPTLAKAEGPRSSSGIAGSSACVCALDGRRADLCGANIAEGCALAAVYDQSDREPLLGIRERAATAEAVMTECPVRPSASREGLMKAKAPEEGRSGPLG